MKRREINQLVREAAACFETHGWALPPNPRWDVTDFGLGDWRRQGLVLVNLTEEAEYCEKLMYAKRGMETPRHHHAKKKEDIICRSGSLRLTVWPPVSSSRAAVSARADSESRETTVRGWGAEIKLNGEPMRVAPGASIVLTPGERVTLMPGVDHAFEPASDECIIGEVSTANDDTHDNFFADPNIGRYAQIEEDEPPVVKLVSDRI